MEPTNASRVGPAAPIAAAGAAAASADHPARRAPDGEVFTTPVVRGVNRAIRSHLATLSARLARA